VILILADSTDPWATLVHREAQRSGGNVFWIQPTQLLDRILLNWPVVNGALVVPGTMVIDGHTIPLADLTGIFARLTLPLPIELEELSLQDRDYVVKETTAAWLAFLNAMPCSVVNRPVPGGRPTILAGSPSCLSWPRSTDFCCRLLAARPVRPMRFCSFQPGASGSI
jgi:hypothetical protein